MTPVIETFHGVKERRLPIPRPCTGKRAGSYSAASGRHNLNSGISTKGQTKTARIRKKFT
jgi:hypothetical protein